MTQGTPNTKGEADFDADAWLAEHDLERRRLKFGGRVFEFNLLLPADKMVEARRLLDGDENNGPAPVIDVLVYFLRDPAEADELRARFRVPVGAQNAPFIATLYDTLFGGVNLGESSASSPESATAGGTPSASTSASDSEPASAQL